MLFARRVEDANRVVFAEAQPAADEFPSRRLAGGAVDLFDSIVRTLAAQDSGV